MELTPGGTWVLPEPPAGDADIVDDLAGLEELSARLASSEVDALAAVDRLHELAAGRPEWRARESQLAGASARFARAVSDAKAATEKLKCIQSRTPVCLDERTSARALRYRELIGKVRRAARSQARRSAIRGRWVETLAGRDGEQLVLPPGDAMEGVTVSPPSPPRMHAPMHVHPPVHPPVQMRWPMRTPAPTVLPEPRARVPLRRLQVAPPVVPGDVVPLRRRQEPPTVHPLRRMQEPPRPIKVAPPRRPMEPPRVRPLPPINAGTAAPQHAARAAKRAGRARRVRGADVAAG